MDSSLSLSFLVVSLLIIIVHLNGDILAIEVDLRSGIQSLGNHSISLLIGGLLFVVTHVVILDRGNLWVFLKGNNLSS